ncbi:MAG: 2-dehydropantoate 2-reductase [Methylobacteriaceae bacterium]|jgi:2-dehydropantoate 2-reductase|nr:2-dehydropantoate 2-reductase [Methylobacteriaceae bacterium]
MKVAVMGAGAVGCYYGAMLARAGHEVCLVGRALHVEAVKARGLILETSRFTEATRVAATVTASGVADADVILFCVKSNDTKAAGNDMARYLSDRVTVLSLQNGVDNAERLQAVLNRPVVPVAVYVATDMPAPGHVRHHGRGELVMGQCPASAAITEAFEHAGIPTKVSGEVIEALWTKLIVNCAYNALSAVAQLPYGRLIEVDGAVDVIRDVVCECIDVSGRLGVSVPEDILETVLGIASSMPSQYSSTAQDLARGKTTEIDYLNGFVVRKAAELGISTPANQSLLTTVKLIEAKNAAGAQ